MKLLFVLLATICGFSLYLLLFQHRLIYFPRHYDQTALPPGVKPVTYRAAAGLQTSYYIPPPVRLKKPRRIWLVLGGNASLALDWLSFAKRFPDEETAFLLFDYPGYGNCQGSASPQTIRDSLQHCLFALSSELHLKRKELAGKLALIGHSLGSAAALQLAVECRIKNLILISPFTSTLEMAKRAVPFPFYHLLLHRYDNKEALTRLLSAPDPPAIVILHGNRDDIVPVKMARSLAGSRPGNLRYIEIKGAGHNDILEIAEPELYRLMLEVR